jgi:hypothetical protein
LKAQKKELDKLNMRKEQLIMMSKWQTELIDIEKQEAEKIIELTNMKYNLTIQKTDKALNEMIKVIKKYGFQEALESTLIAFGEHQKETTFKNIYGICHTRKIEKENPVLKDLYYIRGIMKNRFPNVVDWQAIQIMEQALKADISITELKEMAKNCYSWTSWKHIINDILEVKYNG